MKVDNIAAIARAGADTFVAGSAIFGAPDYTATIAQMRAELARQMSDAAARAAGASHRRQRDRIRSRRHAARHDPRSRRGGERAARRAAATRRSPMDTDSRAGRQRHGESRAPRARAVRRGVRRRRSTTRRWPTRSRATRRTTQRELGRATRAFPGLVRRPRAPARRWAFRWRSSPTRRRASCGRTSCRRASPIASTSIVGGDDLPAKKPDAGPLLHVAAAFGIAPARLLMVGDSANDVQAARAAGCPVLVVPYGYREGRPVQSSDADGIVASLDGGRRPRPPHCPRTHVSFDLFDRNGPVALTGWWRAGDWRWRAADRPRARRRALKRRAPKSLPCRKNRRSAMTEAEFRALAAQGYNRIPLVLETFADLDTPLSLYVKLANAPLHVPARIGRRRRALRPLFVHRPAGDGRASARAAPRSRSTTAASSSSGTTAIRSRSSANSCAATAPRRVRGCRASAAGSPAISATTPCATSRRSSPARAPPADAGPRRHSRHPAAADRGARRRRQPRRQDLPHRLRRSRRGRRLRARAASGCRRCAASCASRWRFRSRRRTPVDRSRQRIRRRRASRPRCAAPRNTSPPATSCRCVLSQRMRTAVHVVAAVAVPRAALAQSVAVHVLLRLRRLPRRRRVAGDPGAQGRRER